MFKEQFGGEPYALIEGSYSYRPVKTAVVDLLHGFISESAARIRRTTREGAAN